jgi:hypothetical protein
VCGLPHIGEVDELCEACMAGKANRGGPITPTTSSGNSYFLLLVYDQSRFMWISTLVRKDQAATPIKDYQMQAEAESGYN